MVRVAGLPLLALLSIGWWTACADDTPRSHSPGPRSPAETYRLFSDAVRDDAPDRAWSLLATGYRTLQYDGDRARFDAAWRDGERHAHLERVDRYAIRDEQIIGEQIGYLEFEASTVAPGESPFFYFVREHDTWCITSHLDPVFQGALEEAVRSGQFRLPPVR